MAYPVSVEWHTGSVAVACPKELADLFDRIAAQCDPNSPQLVIVENEGGALSIGIGGPVSTLNHVLPTSDPPYMVSLGDPDADGVVDFFYCGHHTQMHSRNTIQNELARAVALEYAESGKLSSRVIWEEV